jgi:hypothetical protein
MTVQELIELLEELAEEVGEDAEVRVATQPSWPLRHELAEVTAVEGRVFLAASDGHPYGESPYAPRAAWEGGVIETEQDDEYAADV